MFKRENHPDPEALRQKVAQSDDYKGIKVEVASASKDVEEDRVVITGAWLYQLLFNALANSDSKWLGFHNLNGKLIYYRIGGKLPHTFVGHEIILEENLVLTANACTFQMKKRISEEEKDKEIRKKC